MNPEHLPDSPADRDPLTRRCRVEGCIALPVTVLDALSSKLIEEILDR